jgi:hypothetical protein
MHGNPPNTEDNEYGDIDEYGDKTIQVRKKSHLF